MRKANKTKKSETGQKGNFQILKETEKALNLLVFATIVRPYKSQVVLPVQIWVPKSVALNEGRETLLEYMIVDKTFAQLYNTWSEASYLRPFFVKKIKAGNFEIELDAPALPKFVAKEESSASK